MTSLRRFDGVTPSVAIVRRVAAREGVDPSALTPSLNDAIDADALGRFVTAESDDTARIEFEYCGYQILVYGDGTVSVRSLPGAGVADPPTPARFSDAE